MTKSAVRNSGKRSLSHKLWDDAAYSPLAPGCPACPLFETCGGLRVPAGLIDCNEYCRCPDPAACTMVCPRKPSEYVRRFREVGGYELTNVERVSPLAVPKLPVILPYIGGKYAREIPLAEPAIALSLYDVVSTATGRTRELDHEGLCARFGVKPGATIVVSGAGKDHRVEAWWEMPNREETLRRMRDLGVGLIAIPNFSLFTDVPRPDNLHAMKRLALVWAECMKAGIPAALHTNARTDRDYERFTHFIVARPEVSALAFEFATGCGDASRIDWHVNHLCEIAKAVGRPLTLIVRGGTRKLETLRSAFAHVVLIETEAYMRSIKRRRAYITGTGRVKWTKYAMPTGDPIDGLLIHNIRIVRSVLDTAHQRERLRSA
ncbi:MAG: hypothetical protein JWP08_4024 [Bryobacterales bacterium]|nr:hypothetical protein [Bryobacterales bacterium]